MRATELELPGVFVLDPKVHGDARGFFFESWSAQGFRAATGAEVSFVQDNHSRSARGVLRGLHYQLPPQAQGKLVRVTAGEVFDVAVDLRRGSKTFGRWTAARLSAENFRQLWIPPGFAHGFVVVSPWAEVLYKTTAPYAPALERSIRWDDPALAIAWPLAESGTPILSPKDAAAPRFAEAELPA